MSDVGRTLGAFLRRDLVTAQSYRLPFVLDIGSAVLQVALFFYLSAVIDRSGADFLRAFEGGYFAYVVVGLVVMRTVDTTVRAFPGALRNEQVAGTFEALVATPPSLPTLVLGGAAYSVLYGVAVAALMAVVAALLGVGFHATWASAGAALLAYVGCIAVFAGVGMAIAAFVVVYKQGNAVLGLVAQVLGLLAGVYFPVALLPPVLQALGRLVPLTWTLDAVRGGLLAGEVHARPVVALLVAGIVAPTVATVLLRRAVDRARREGTLAQH